MPAAQVQAAADQMEVAPLPPFVANGPLGQAEAALQRTQVSWTGLRSDAGAPMACLHGQRRTLLGDRTRPLAHM